jgi:hypothetical protein
MSTTQPPKVQLLLPGQRHEGPLIGADTQQISLADVFGNNFEGAVIMREVSLNTEDIRKLVRRDYLYLSKMLHTVTRTREFRGINPGPLNKIEDGLEEKIQQIKELIGLRRVEVQKRFNKKPDATVDVTHARTTTFNAPIASPHANSYLDLLLDADEFISRATACWLQGLMKPQEFHGSTREIKRSLHSIKADVTKARTECFKMLDRASAGLPSTDPEAAQMKADAGEMAKTLVSDANADQEVMASLSISEQSDLQRIAEQSNTTGKSTKSQSATETAT